MLTNGIGAARREGGTAGAVDGDITRLFGEAFTTQLRGDGNVGVVQDRWLPRRTHLRECKPGKQGQHSERSNYSAKIYHFLLLVNCELNRSKFSFNLSLNTVKSQNLFSQPRELLRVGRRVIFPNAVKAIGPY